MNFILLQSSNATAVIITLVVLLVLFLIFRGVLLWFWKVDVIVDNQKEQINQFKKIVEQNELIINGLSFLNVDQTNLIKDIQVNKDIISVAFEPVRINSDNKTLLMLFASQAPLTGGKFNVLVGDDDVFRSVPIGSESPLEYDVLAGNIKVLIGVSSVVSTEKVVFITVTEGMESYFDIFEYYYKK